MRGARLNYNFVSHICIYVNSVSLYIYLHSISSSACVRLDIIELLLLKRRGKIQRVSELLRELTHHQFIAVAYQLILICLKENLYYIEIIKGGNARLKGCAHLIPFSEKLFFF